MKRHPSLQPLSDDHHRALVLARRLRNLANQNPRALATVARDVRQEFAADLEPHFRIEERVLLPALDAAGEAELTRRVREDHLLLRQQVAEPWTGITPSLFGELLEKHVRFEERQVFPRAEVVLSSATLEAIREATTKGQISRAKDIGS